MMSSHDVSLAPVSASVNTILETNSPSEEPLASPYGTAPPPFECDHCDFTEGLTLGIKNHLKNYRHHEQSSCHTCDFRATDSVFLTHHICNVHMKSIPEVSATKLQSLHCGICACTPLKEQLLVTM